MCVTNEIRPLSRHPLPLLVSVPPETKGWGWWVLLLFHSPASDSHPSFTGSGIRSLRHPSRKCRNAFSSSATIRGPLRRDLGFFPPSRFAVLCSVPVLIHRSAHSPPPRTRPPPHPHDIFVSSDPTPVSLPILAPFLSIRHTVPPIPLSLQRHLPSGPVLP